MTDQRTTRRKYLQQLGVGGFAMALGTNSTRTDTPAHDVGADDLLVPEAAAPVGFETASTTEQVPMVEDLQTADPRFVDADTAVRGFWAGHDEDNPRWVLSCLGIVCDQAVVRQSVETAGSRANEAFVEKYDAETPPSIGFEQSRTHHATMTDWRVDLVRQPEFRATSSSSAVLFTDLMRLEFHENVLLGTVVFGPDASDHDVEAMLNRYSRLQRSRLRAHTTDT